MGAGLFLIFKAYENMTAHGEEGGKLDKIGMLLPGGFTVFVVFAALLFLSAIIAFFTTEKETDPSAKMEMDEKYRLFLMMLEYAETGEEPTEYIGNEAFLFPVAKQMIDLASEKNEKLRESGMPVVDTLGNVFACICEADMVIVIDCNEPLVLHLFKYNRHCRT